MKLFVNLNTPEKAHNFVNICSRYKFNVDTTSGKFIVSGKSVLGIFSLNTREPIEIRVYDGTSEEYSKFTAELKDSGLIYCSRAKKAAS